VDGKRPRSGCFTMSVRSSRMDNLAVRSASWRDRSHLAVSASSGLLSQIRAALGVLTNRLDPQAISVDVTKDATELRAQRAPLTRTQASRQSDAVLIKQMLHRRPNGRVHAFSRAASSAWSADVARP
jgi:hypothetical protein